MEPPASVIAELGRENETHIEIFDLDTGKGRIFEKEDLRKINKDVSDDFAVQTIGLTKLLRWKIARATRTVRTGRPAWLTTKMALSPTTAFRARGSGLSETVDPS